LINEIFLTVFEGFEAQKRFSFRGSASDLTEGTYSALPDPLAEISKILFEMITEMLREKQF